MHYWLLKTEPSTYSWTDLVTDGGTFWSGVRNFQARNNLRAMEEGDLALIYHSVKETSIVGIAQITKAARPDPTTTDTNWVAVDIIPVKPLTRPIPLAEVKSDEILSKMVLATHSRLSVSPVKDSEFKRILELSATKL